MLPVTELSQLPCQATALNSIQEKYVNPFRYCISTNSWPEKNEDKNEVCIEEGVRPHTKSSADEIRELKFKTGERQDSQLEITRHLEMA